MGGLPDKNLFMMCPEYWPATFGPFPDGFLVREMKEADLPAWMAMPFDNPRDAKAHHSYMEQYVTRVYGPDLHRFFDQTTVVEQDGHMVGVCTRWKAYGKIETVQWLKVKPECEGVGLGRALMSRLLEHAEFPVYLHTQPESFRAIGLYADMGFLLLDGERFGGRVNHLDESMPYLQQRMTPQAFRKLRTTAAPASFLEVMAEAQTNDF